jgi:transposase-like protein
LSPLIFLEEAKKMSQKFTLAFKIQAVEKALSRSEGVSILDIAETLGVGYSTLQKWIVQSRNHQLEPAQAMTKEKRPQDWTQEERLNLIIECGSLTEQAISEHCRAQGLYPYHIQQWKDDFSTETSMNTESKKSSETKKLRTEIKELKKDLNRKNKALAETAALLVLQKKVNAIWGSDEDSSQ